MRTHILFIAWLLLSGLLHAASDLASAHVYCRIQYKLSSAKAFQTSVILDAEGRKLSNNGTFSLRMPTLCTSKEPHTFILDGRTGKRGAFEGELSIELS